MTKENEKEKRKHGQCMIICKPISIPLGHIGPYFTNETTKLILAEGRVLPLLSQTVIVYIEIMYRVKSFNN